MTVLIIVVAALIGAAVGARIGLTIGLQRTAAALKLARYRQAITLLRALVNTPDALTLRPRALDVLTEHDAASRHNPHDIHITEG